MDFDEAIKAHASWKTKLSLYIKNPNKSLDPAVVCLDNKCTLGQWIYGEGKKYEGVDGFNDLRDVHSKFHKTAAEIVKQADSGKNMTEQVALGSGSEYVQLSTKITQLLMKMKSQVK